MYACFFVCGMGILLCIQPKFMVTLSLALLSCAAVEKVEAGNSSNATVLYFYATYLPRNV